MYSRWRSTNMGTALRRPMGMSHGAPKKDPWLARVLGVMPEDSRGKRGGGGGGVRHYEPGLRRVCVGGGGLGMY